MESARWAFRCGAWNPSRAEWMFAARCVQPEERDRIKQFMFNKDAKAAMAGRLLIRKLVCVKMALPWDGFRLGRTSRGKPYVAHPPAGTSSAHWRFNISHQGDFAVLAAEFGRQVGVDVMKTTRPGSSSVPEFFRVMKRQFTDFEWRTITSAQSDWDQLQLFYRHWALKESFIKAIGSGLGFNLQRAEFHIEPIRLEEGRVFCQSRMHLDEEEDEDWIFEECLLDEHHQVAVALGKPDAGVENASAGSGRTCRSETSGPRGNFPPFSQDAGKARGATECGFTVLSFKELIAEATPLSDEDPADWESFRGKQEAPIRQSEG